MSMLLRAIIIDDEETGIETLKLLLDMYVENVKVVAHSTRPSAAIELIENYKPEIVFLDISMPEMDGFELLDKLTWKNFKLIFTTAHQEYGLKALKLQATDYLLKPVDHTELRKAVERVRQSYDQQVDLAQLNDYSKLNSIDQHQTGKLGISSKNGVEFVDPLNIVSLESKSNYTLVSLEDSREILSPKTLRDFELQLHASHFMRVHHSYMINLHKITRYIKEDDSIVMINKQRIPLAKSRKDNFYKWLNI